MLDEEQLERAVDVLVHARRVLGVTTSDLAMLGQYAMVRLAMTGHSGTNSVTIRVVDAATAAGATAIAITSFARGPLADAAGVHLAVGSADASEPVHDLSRVRAGQMAMIDVLQNAVAARSQTADASSSTYRALSQYVHRRSPSAARPPDA